MAEPPGDEERLTITTIILRKTQTLRRHLATVSSLKSLQARRTATLIGSYEKGLALLGELLKLSHEVSFIAFLMNAG